MENENKYKIIYVDMVADMLHYGHLNYLTQIYDNLIKNTNNKLYLGIHNDNVAQFYKRKPILTMNERINILSYFPLIDKIIPNAPINVDEEYIILHKIDFICMPNNRTDEEIKLMYEYAQKNNMIKIFNYTESISRSDIIKRIKDINDL